MSAKPVADNKRVVAIDALRGFAILGIFAVNVITFAWPSAALSAPDAMGSGEWNRVGFTITQTVFYGKFMFLFAMLFGASIVFFERKTQVPGKPSPVLDGTKLWARRQGVLFAFGLVHGIALWYGDILAPYAVVGLGIAWWLRRLDWRLQVGIGVIAHVVGSALLAAVFLAFGATMTGDQAAQQAQSEIDAHLGSYLQTLSFRLLILFGYWFVLGPIFALQIGGMMLWGVALSRAGILTAQRPAAFYAKCAMLTLPLGAALTGGVHGALLAILGEDRGSLVWTGVGQLVGVPLGLGYASMVIWVVLAGVLRPVTGALANVGRMALSNYLAQTLIAVTIFYGWGFGAFASVDYPGLFGVIGAVWLFNLLLSAAWLRFFRIGPAEWLWRSLTYGQTQSIRRVKVESG
ncbi:MAG: DUF418 domain-containing protein [Planctomycetota bacterium]